VHHVRQVTIGFLLFATIFGGIWMFRISSDTLYSIDKPSPITKQDGHGSDTTGEDLAPLPGDGRVLDYPTPSATPTPTRTVAPSPAAKPKPSVVIKKAPATTAPKPRPRASAPPAAGKPAPADEQAEDRVVTLVNAERAKAGCGAVHSDGRLDAAAQGHSDDMARRNYFAHDTPDGVDPWERARAAGYTTPTGENIAMGQRTAESVMDSWMNSSGHRANILNCDSHAIGMGLGRNTDGTPYWTQMFGSV
jgi:uncharacterized protein YkwD